MLKDENGWMGFTNIVDTVPQADSAAKKCMQAWYLVYTI
jgi:hypothetical protein